MEKTAKICQNTEEPFRQISRDMLANERPKLPLRFS
jgi:hypothetical protein